MQVSEGRYRKFYSISKWIKKLNDSCKMFIYDIYRLDHMSLRIKLFWFLTSVMDIVRYSTRFIFKKKGKWCWFKHWKQTYKIFRNTLQRKMLKQMKKREGFSIITEYSKKPHSMEDKDSFSFTYGVDRICSGNLFHVREKV